MTIKDHIAMVWVLVPLLLSLCLVGIPTLVGMPTQTQYLSIGCLLWTGVSIPLVIREWEEWK